MNGKKQKEKENFEKFLDFFEGDRPSFICREKPDFLIEIEGTRIGFEHTTFHTFDGSSPSNEARKNERRENFIKK